MIIEWIKPGKPSLVGFVTGTIAGLAAITPASGFVGPMGAVILGIAAAPVCYGMVHVIKHRFQIDDSLGVFADHGVGDLTGTIMVAFLALPSFGGLGLAEGVTAGQQLWVQFVGAMATAAWANVVIIRLVTPMRVSEEDGTEDLDITSHGERGYN
jgi:Amt family ammonium transporter